MKNLIHFFVLTFFVMNFWACNSESQTTAETDTEEPTTEVPAEADNNQTDEPAAEGHPDSEIDKALIGTWDLVEDPVFGTVKAYFVVSEKAILREGHNFATNKNPIFAKNGQIWTKMTMLNDQLKYSYDYVLEENKLFLLNELTPEMKDVKASPKTIVLTRSE